MSSSFPDQCVVSGGSSGNVYVWDCENLEPFCVIPDAHPNGAIWCSTHVSEARVVTSSVDKSIRMWDLDLRQSPHRGLGHSAAVNDLVYVPHHERVFSASSDSTVRVWTLPDLSCVDTWPNFQRDVMVYAIQVIHLIEQLVSGDYAGNLSLRSLATGRVIRRRDSRTLSRSSSTSSSSSTATTSRSRSQAHKDGVLQLDFDPVSKILFSASNDASVAAFAPTEDIRVCLARLSHASPVKSICCVPERRVLLTGDRVGVIRLFDVRAMGEKYGEVCSAKIHEGCVRRIRWIGSSSSQDGGDSSGSWGFSVGEDSSVRKWNCGCGSFGEEVGVGREERSFVNALCLIQKETRRRETIYPDVILSGDEDEVFGWRFINERRTYLSEPHSVGEDVVQKIEISLLGRSDQEEGIIRVPRALLHGVELQEDIQRISISDRLPKVEDGVLIATLLGDARELPSTALFDYYRLFLELQMPDFARVCISMIGKVTGKALLCKLFLRSRPGYGDEIEQEEVEGEGDEPRLEDFVSPESFHEVVLSVLDSRTGNLDELKSLGVYRDSSSSDAACRAVMTSLESRRQNPLHQAIQEHHLEVVASSEFSSFHSVAARYLRILHSTRAGTDVVLQTSASALAQHPAHLAVLAGSLNVIARMLRFGGSELEELKTFRRIVLWDLKDDDIEPLLKFLYCRKLDVSDFGILFRLLNFGGKHQQPELVDAAFSRLRVLSLPLPSEGVIDELLNSWFYLEDPRAVEESCCRMKSWNVGNVRELRRRSKLTGDVQRMSVELSQLREAIAVLTSENRELRAVVEGSHSILERLVPIVELFCKKAGV